MGAIDSLNQVRSDLALELTRAVGELHQLYEKTSLLEARKQRLQERLNAVDEAVFALKENDQ
jgi:hypothetical protein